MGGNTQKNKKIKCVVWDLDNTLWNGILLENDTLSLRENSVRVVKTLDKRGILQSIASKNDYNLAMAEIEKFGLKDLFLYPQINWNAKSSSLQEIAKLLNININSFAFVDDQAFEREEVGFVHREVLCIDALDVDKMPDMPEMNPRFLTDESEKRREMYLNDMKRKKIEDEFKGPQEEFLSSLNMVLTITPAGEDDLKRAEELTMRTHQLNTTGYTYSYEELNDFRKSDRYKLFIASLDDKYGTYGKIGLCLIETKKDIWFIKLLLMSCRVISRGVGSVFINHIRNEARKNNVALRAEFIETDVNRMMYMTYKFNYFKELEKKENVIIFENDLTQAQPFPGYLKVINYQ